MQLELKSQHWERQWTEERGLKKTGSKEGKVMNLLCQISMFKACNV